MLDFLTFALLTIFADIILHSVKKLKQGASTGVLNFVHLCQSVQSVTDFNRMFYNALLMICWNGAIPLSFMSFPQVQSCDSLMKGFWWKLWDNIIFGVVPYDALRLANDPTRETWLGLWFAAVQLGAHTNSSLSVVWGTWHFWASLLDIIVCLHDYNYLFAISNLFWTLKIGLTATKF